VQHSSILIVQGPRRNKESNYKSFRKLAIYALIRIVWLYINDRKVAIEKTVSLE